METNQEPVTSENFSADLQNDTETVTDVGQSTRDFLWKRHPVHSFFTIVLPMCVGTALAIYIALTHVMTKDTTNLIWGIFVVSLSIVGISYSRVSSRMKHLFYSELEPALGCAYNAQGVVPSSGRLFTFGNNRRVDNEFSCIYKNVPFRFADYSHDEGSGKSRRTVEYTIADASLGGETPRILCLPAGYTPIELLDPWKPAGYRRLPLEGDFDTKFTVYVPEDREVEALQVLEPDVMAKLMDEFPHHGFECVDSHLYMFTEGSMDANRDSIMKTFASFKRYVDVLTPELAPFLNTEAPSTT